MTVKRTKQSSIIINAAEHAHFAWVCMIINGEHQPAVQPEGHIQAEAAQSLPGCNCCASDLKGMSFVM